MDDKIKAANELVRKIAGKEPVTGIFMMDDKECLDYCTVRFLKQIDWILVNHSGDLIFKAGENGFTVIDKGNNFQNVLRAYGIEE